MKKILGFVLLAAFACVLVTACSDNTEMPTEPMQEEAATETPMPVFSNGMILPEPPATVVALTADGPDEGFDLDVGTVTLTNDADNFYVALQITDPDWCLVQVHLDVADSPEKLPQTRKGNPIPGQFAYSATYELDFPCEQSPEPFVVPLADWAPGTQLYVAVHTEVVSAIDGCYEEVWQIGDVEVVNEGTGWLENYADEFNWVGATATTAGPGLAVETPPYAIPFIVGTSATDMFPYNSNFKKPYAKDFDVQWFGGLPFGGMLTVSWSPGQSAIEKKIVSSGDGITSTIWTATGAPSSGQGWFLDKYPLTEDYVMVDPIATDDHTIRFQHTQGDGTFWDWLLLEKACERNETAWAEGTQFPGNNWGMYIEYEVVLVVGGWNAMRGDYGSFPEGVPFAKARASLEQEYVVEYRTFETLSASALEGVHVAILASLFYNTSGSSLEIDGSEQAALAAYTGGDRCAILLTDGTSFNAGNNALTAPYGLTTTGGFGAPVLADILPAFSDQGTYKTNHPGYYANEAAGTAIAAFSGGQTAGVMFDTGPVFAFSDINMFWNKEGTTIGGAFFSDNEQFFLDVVAACFAD